jgi:hypothetical protein
MKVALCINAPSRELCSERLSEVEEMKLLGLFMAGFASGWIVRGSVDSSRSVAVGAVAMAYGAFDRAKRIIATERENLEDLFAEGKARYEAKRDRAARAAAPSGPRAAEVVRPQAQEGRAA